MMKEQSGGPNRPVLLRTEKLSMTYKRGRNISVEALYPLSMSVHKGEIIGIVGESGSGKSTLLKLIAGLQKPTGGQIVLQGRPLDSRETVRQAGRTVQMVFQEPAASFNPRKKMRSSIEDHMKRLNSAVHATDQKAGINHLLWRTGINPALAERRPSEVSGGQCQRIAIARALAVQPELLLCDEITSALDVTTQAEIITLLQQLHADIGMSILFVTHDLALAASFCHRLMVMKDGRCLEEGKTRQLISSPWHDYTKILLADVLDPLICLKEREAAGEWH